MPKSKTPVYQTHHVIYGKNDNPRKQRDITRRIRRGVHNVVTKLRHFKSLTAEEVNCICVEALLRQEFNQCSKKEEVDNDP